MNPGFRCAASGLLALLEGCAGPRPIFDSTLDHELADCEEKYRRFEMISEPRVSDPNVSELSRLKLRDPRSGRIKCGLSSNKIDTLLSWNLSRDTTRTIAGAVEVTFSVSPEGKVESAVGKVEAVIARENEQSIEKLGQELIKRILVTRFSVSQSTVTANYRVEIKQEGGYTTRVSILK